MNSGGTRRSSGGAAVKVRGRFGEGLGAQRGGSGGASARPPLWTSLWDFYSTLTKTIQRTRYQGNMCKCNRDINPCKMLRLSQQSNPKFFSDNGLNIISITHASINTCNISNKFYNLSSPIYTTFHYRFTPAFSVLLFILKIYEFYFNYLFSIKILILH